MSDAILNATALRKSYRSGDRVIEVLRGAALTVAPGESVGIRGESGSGKTTLLNLLAGLDASEGGEPGEQIEERGFAGAGFPADAHAFAGRHRERRAPQHLDQAVAAAITPAQAIRAKNRIRHGRMMVGTDRRAVRLEGSFLVGARSCRAL